MGHNRRFRVLNDASRYDADFALICRGSGREVVVERRTFIAMVEAMALPRDVELLGRRLRCSACQCRSVRVELSPAGTPHALKLGDGDSLPPRRMSFTEWLKMPERERTRYWRSLR